MAAFFKKRQTFIPKADETEKVIQMIRAELLEEGEISEETIAVVSLLDKSELLNKYFSKHESKQVKERLEFIKNTSSNQLVKQMSDYVDSMLAAFTAVIVSTTMH